MLQAVALPPFDKNPLTCRLCRFGGRLSLASTSRNPPGLCRAVRAVRWASCTPGLQMPSSRCNRVAGSDRSLLEAMTRPADRAVSCGSPGSSPNSGVQHTVLEPLQGEQGSRQAAGRHTSLLRPHHQQLKHEVV